MWCVKDNKCGTLIIWVDLVENFLIAHVIYSVETSQRQKNKVLYLIVEFHLLIGGDRRCRRTLPEPEYPRPVSDDLLTST